MTALVLQQNRLHWYGHVLRKDDDDWVKKCMEYEVEGPRPRGRPKRNWKEVVREDCQTRKLNKEAAMDRCKRRKLIKDVRSSGRVWVAECFFWYRPTQVVPDKRLLNGCACMRVGKPSAASKSGQMRSEQDATEPLLRSLRSHLAMLVYHAWLMMRRCVKSPTGLRFIDAAHVVRCKHLCNGWLSVCSSVCLSILSIDSTSSVRLVCCWARAWATDINQ